MKIRELKIFSANIEGQIQFYKELLHFPVMDLKSEKASFKIGSSVLTLLSKKNATPYHFAINIPSNLALDALDWLKQKRVPILKHNGDELIDFYNWNAESLYFYDCDKNIVEFIARKNLHVQSEKPFIPGKMICISEIGMPVNDIKKAFNELDKIHELKVYDGNFDKFCAAGDENGLFIIIDKAKKKWMPTNDTAFSSDFIMTGDFNFEFVNGNIKRTAGY